MRGSLRPFRLSHPTDQFAPCPLLNCQSVAEGRKALSVQSADACMKRGADKRGGREGVRRKEGSGGREEAEEDEGATTAKNGMINGPWRPGSS